MIKEKAFVFSLGGSLIIPKERINVLFLKKFKNFITTLLQADNRIVIVVGGGSVNKKYNTASQKITKIKNVDLDWLGIAATKLNAELLRVMFSQYAYSKVLDNPQIRRPDLLGRSGLGNRGTQLIIASGWKPGCSSDLDAVLWAKQLRVKTVINLTDIDYVYDKDPDVYKSARPIKNINWSEFIKIVGTKWSPRGNWPFDPVASQLAQRLKIKVVIVNGKNLQNLKNYIDSKKFKGTIIS